MRQRILNPEQLYSAYQLGLVLRLSADTIRKMARKHEIPYVIVGGRMQFCGWQIKNWMQQNTVQPSSEDEQQKSASRKTCLSEAW
ncbi:helix-turn-helix domain-containing protein [Dialister hominis]|uniref:helix-turn-helix domain-containing protein n=1 Tax=Dialister hominis TaxID=2582419 RepID=UPI0040272C5A